MARRAMSQALIIGHPEEYNNKGQKIRRAGVLGKGQAYTIFGSDIIRNAKLAHGLCYSASKIHLKDEETLNKRVEKHEKAIEYCRSTLRQLDFCLREYGRTESKRRSINYMSKIAFDMIKALQDRINRDRLIYKQHYQKDKHKKTKQ